MKKVLALALSLALAAGLATVAFAATPEGDTSVAGKKDSDSNTIYLGVSGDVQPLIGDGNDIVNDDGDYAPGTKFRVDVVEIDEDGTNARAINKSRFNKSGADVYFKANKGSKYFEKAEMKFESVGNTSNAYSYAQVKLKYPYLNMKSNEIEFKLGVKKGSSNQYFSLSGDVGNLFRDDLSEDDTDVTIDKVGYRFKVDDSGFSDIIEIDFDADDEVHYEVKMYNKDEIVLYLDTDADKSLGTSFDDVDFDFFFFSQVGTFSAIGTLTIPGNEGDYVYELVTGTPSEVYATFGENEFLVPVNATWNADEEALQFKTRNLGKYVVSSVQLDLSEWEDMADDTDVSIDDDTDIDDDVVSDIDDSDIDDSDPIPETGANGLANVAAVAGVIALAAAGAVAFKK